MAKLIVDYLSKVPLLCLLLYTWYFCELFIFANVGNEVAMVHAVSLQEKKLV